MMADKFIQPPMRRAAFAEMLAKATQELDPVLLAMLAIDRVWARPRCGPAPRAWKSASRRRTRLLRRYCERRWPELRFGVAPIG